MRINSPAKVKIMNGFTSLMQERTLSGIKVIDIIKESGVSHQTFYRTFLDKYDLAEKACASKLELIYSVVGKNPTWRDAAMCTLNVIANDGTFFANILSEPEGIEAMKAAMLSVDTEYLGIKPGDMIANAWLHNLVNWSEEGFETPADVICDKILRSLPVEEIVEEIDIDPYLSAYQKIRVTEFKNRGKYEEV